MKDAIVISLMFLGLALGQSLAKDKEYKVGTVSKLTIESGWVDTTHCHEGLDGNLHCSGGIENEYKDVYLLTMEDGVVAPIRHTAFQPDTLKSLNIDNGVEVPIMYRIERKKGLISVDYVRIPDATSPKKEGCYNFDSMKKPTSNPSPKVKPPANQSNIDAMCASGKLTPEQHAKYCTPPQNGDKQ